MSNAKRRPWFDWVSMGVGLGVALHSVATGRAAVAGLMGFLLGVQLSRAVERMAPPPRPPGSEL
jgi:hypothetical protein